MKNQAHAFNSPVEEAQVATNGLSLAALVEQIQSSDAYAEISIREAAAEAIFEAMEKREISRAELARRLGKSRPYITKLLSGEENLSIETLAKIFRVLDCEFRIDYSLSKKSRFPLGELEVKPCGTLRCLPGGMPFNWRQVSLAELSCFPDETGRRPVDLALC